MRHPGSARNGEDGHISDDRAPSGRDGSVTRTRLRSIEHRRRPVGLADGQDEAQSAQNLRAQQGDGRHRRRAPRAAQPAQEHSRVSAFGVFEFQKLIYPHGS